MSTYRSFDLTLLGFGYQEIKDILGYNGLPSSSLPITEDVGRRCSSKRWTEYRSDAIHLLFPEWQIFGNVCRTESVSVPEYCLSI